MGSAFLKETFAVGSATASVDTSVPYVAGSTLVYLDGLLLKEGVSSAVADYSEAGGTSISLLCPPHDGQTVTVAYQAS